MSSFPEVLDVRPSVSLVVKRQGGLTVDGCSSYVGVRGTLCFSYYTYYIEIKIKKREGDLKGKLNLFTNI